MPDMMLVAEATEVLREKLPEIAGATLRRLREKTEDPVQQVVLDVVADWSAENGATQQQVAGLLRQISVFFSQAAVKRQMAGQALQDKLTAEQLTKLTDAAQGLEAKQREETERFARTLSRSIRLFATVAGRAIVLAMVP